MIRYVRQSRNVVLERRMKKVSKKRLSLALQKDIEGIGKYVSILLKLCEHLKGNIPFGQNALMTWDADRVRKVAKNLEHRWHSIWLKSLERQCILEQLLGSSNTGCEILEKSFSEEPLKKYPRLGDNIETIAQIENELKGQMNLLLDKDSLKNSLTIQTNEITLKNDKAVMVGSTGIAQLKADCGGGTGKFEIIQDIGYSSETSAHLSTDEKTESADFQECFSPNLQPKTALSGDRSAVSRMYLPPDKYPSVSLKTLNILSEDRSLYNSKRDDCKSVPNSFYKVACIDDDVFDDAVKAPGDTEKKNVTDVLNKTKMANDLKSEEGAAVNVTPKTHKPVEKSKAKNLSASLENAASIGRQVIIHPENGHTAQKKSRKGSKDAAKYGVNAINSHELLEKSARVCEWLKKCHSGDDATSDDNMDSREKVGKSDWSQKAVNSSCDASGECTTTESDSERSNASDVNNSVTLSQSFTGSIETVIPAPREDITATNNNQVTNVEPSPGVRMRKKKRSTRDRPWSVVELNRSELSSATVPHSTSEGALNLLYCSQDSAKSVSKKFSKNKRRSLTDISNLCSPSSRGQLWRQKSFNDPPPQPSSSLEQLIAAKKGGSVSDYSSDNCKTLLDTTLKAEPIEISRCIDTFGDVQVILSETNSLPETVDTDTIGGTASAEDQCSISDQAWDEYQDPPYLSEPYSEQTVDEDEVRKLISFGDDYRAILDSYSDASSISLRVPPLKHRKKSLAKSNGHLSSDSNSDSEDFHHILETSSKAFQFVSNSIKESSNKMSSLSSEFAELVATCQTNLRHLNEVATAGGELESVSKEDIGRLKDLIKDWEELEKKVLVLSRSNKPNSFDLEAATGDVHSSLASLKEKLGNMSEHAKDAFDTAMSLEQVTANIQNLQTSLSTLQEMKESVLSINARILRLIADGGHSLTSLKENATKLYQQWEDVYELNCSQLTKLLNLQSHWGESTEGHLNEDLETTVQWQPVQVGSSLPKAEVTHEALHPITAAEVQVADQHDVVFEIENDTSKATIQCVLVESTREEMMEPLLHWNLPVQRMNANVLDEDIPDVKPEHKTCHPTASKRSCLWRTLQAAFPIHLALVILYCLSCYMEPQCCENINNYDFSILPKLTFPNGPPPV
ncbi:uncharacterized protein LOC129968820 isoform X2 [Argiope bruennichi]|uniref:uncharacterized protein LOC129968820 isoform X2 n=1 Tax=Argiope bruennichi TaxID=94029 RepID=UPI0024945272|nr:uncharacterized protein LOC129968820 isoform X2 [Argiope bruennichi]